jgi:hypothetical protein
MIRYYLSPLIYSAADDSRQPAIAELGGINWVCAAGAGDVALVLVNAPEADHHRLREDMRSWAFPRLFAPEAEPDREKRRKTWLELLPYHEQPIQPIIRGSLVRRIQEILGLNIAWLDPKRHVARDVLRAVQQRICGASDVSISDLWVSGTDA